MLRRGYRAIWLAGLALAVGAIAGPAVVLAQDQATPARPATVTIEPPVRGADGWSIEAIVRDTSGEPVNGVPVRFGVAVDFLGPRTVVIGASATDAAGVASIVYQPTWSGEQTLVARVMSDSAPLVSAPVTIETSGASPIRSEGAALPIVGAFAGPVAAVVVLGVWAVLIGLLVTVAVGIKRGSDAGRGRARSGASAERLERAQSTVEGG